MFWDMFLVLMMFVIARLGDYSGPNVSEAYLMLLEAIWSNFGYF